jgi:hypothetical protein
VPDDHTLLLSLKVDEYPGCSLGGFASVTKNPKVLFFTEPGPGRIAPASATVRLPPIASADEDVVDEVVRARLKRQGGAVFAIWGDRNANEESAWGRLGEHRLLEGDTLIHTLSVVALAPPTPRPRRLETAEVSFPAGTATVSHAFVTIDTLRLALDAICTLTRRCAEPACLT